MGARGSSHAAAPFAITKTKILLIISLAVTWWLAHVFPHYQPRIRAELDSRINEARQKIPSIKVDWHPTDDPRAAYNASKLALLIEPRPIPHLVPQLLHMITVVPPDWRFLFIGTPKSVAAVGRAITIKHQQVVGKLDLMIMPEPWEIESKEAVYRMLTDVRFYDEFLPGVEWILKYEHDSILCANSERSLNDWLDWSWAGAPRSPDDRFSGNGGLSLRRVSAIRRILEFQARYNDTEAEDEWFGKRLWVLPGEKVAAGSHGVLAVEDVYMEQPMGYHVRDGGQSLHDDVWKDYDQRRHIFEYCPELSLIMDMKLERERCPGDDRQGTVTPTEEERQREQARIAAENALRLDEERRKKLMQDQRKQAAQEEEQKKQQAAAAEEEQRKKAAEAEEAQRKKADEDEEQRKKAEEGGQDKVAGAVAAVPANSTATAGGEGHDTAGGGQQDAGEEPKPSEGQAAEPEESTDGEDGQQGGGGEAQSDGEGDKAAAGNPAPAAGETSADETTPEGEEAGDASS